MLLLCFTLGDEHYALPAQDVDAVLPWVHCRSIPEVPEWVRGYMVYRGAAVPVVDVWHLATQVPAPHVLGSRMMLMTVHHQGLAQRVAFLVGNLTQTCDDAELRFEDEVLHASESPWSGALAYRDGILLQVLHVDALLSEEMCALLFEHGMDAVVRDV